jgi:hypothetical protein
LTTALPNIRRTIAKLCLICQTNLRKKEFKTDKKMTHVKTNKIRKSGKNVQGPNALMDTQKRNATDLSPMAITKVHKPIKMKIPKKKAIRL